MTQTTSPDQAVIQELEDKRYAAVLNQDYDTFEDLCHADLVYGHTGGNRDSLETYLSKLRSGALRYHRIDHPVENIVLVGDAALVTGQMSADLTINGSNKTLNNSALAVWTKDAGEWKFVAYQPTPQGLSA
ncbi:nuclear transport factor 2 family protein [Pseudarthrobacter sp. NIBRBAC000502772]|uniref:nuclear transport factor 2 family protein n=1 Tax=Pseudarthrobacter sp. NIBRBAC000502772 TaxID=2590775 RepID=UPI001AEF5AF1|nr:nuclear transport factor 2 family protein [Pseudarthrobacter sp. NIBRBAC000502772]